MEGRSPLKAVLDSLNIFSYRGCVDVALYLIKCGCGGEEDKVKLLYKACSVGKLDVVKELVEQHGIDPNGEIVHVRRLKNNLISSTMHDITRHMC